jgi:hypothetical protein
MNKILLALLLILGWHITARAQGLDLAAEDPNKPVELALNPDPDIPKGKVAVMRGEADGQGHRFLVRGLDVMQPIAVTAFAEKTGLPLRTAVYKENWQETVRDESTGDQGRVNLRFRTAGDFGVWVKSEGPEPVPYYLVVWAGDALEVPVPSPFRKATAAELNPSGGAQAASGGGGGLGTTGWLAIVAGLLVVIGGLLVMVLRGQRRASGSGPGGSAVVVLLLSLLAGPVLASPPLPASGREAAEAYERAGYEQLARNNEGGGSDGPSASDLLGTLGDAYENIRSAAELAQEYGLLHPSDEAAQPNYRPEGMPDVPSACAGNAACTECYTEAQGNLNQARRALEKLRSIGAATKKRTDKAIALGDAGAGAIPGSVSALAWIKEKKGIEAELETFKGAYDNKYRELLRNLHDHLLAVGRCEEQLGMQDWYNRYGFVYYQFMEERYKRNWE